MGVSNRVGSKIESTKSDPEAKVSMKIYDIKSDHMKTVDSLDMKISAITSNKPSSSYGQPSSDIKKLPLLISPNIHMHHNSLNICPP